MTPVLHSIKDNAKPGSALKRVHTHTYMYERKTMIYSLLPVAIW